MNYYGYSKLFLLALSLLLVVSCKKFLDAKPDLKLATPSSLSELQALLDDTYTMNLTPGCLKTASDEYYLTQPAFNSVPNQWDRDVYLWQPNLLLDNDWNAMYRAVFSANTVLDNIRSVPGGGLAGERQNVEGSALFYRAWAFYHLAQAFAPAYAQAGAGSKMGIPLRLDADFSKPSVRASLQATYGQLSGDLEEAATLLPAVARHVTRPSKPAAYALLARVRLSTGDYPGAFAAADSALIFYKGLMDYNTVSTASAAPFPLFNKEVIFHAVNRGSGTLTASRARIDSLLVTSYETGDLRLAAFFKDNGNGSFSFKGSYNGSTSSETFSGIATDEVLLVKAEAAARTGNTMVAMETLNSLLETRWKTGLFEPLTAASPEEALGLILRERGKELVYRGTRWSDIKRLYKDGGLTLRRLMDGKEFDLESTSDRATFLIPQTVISLSGMAQNP